MIKSAIFHLIISGIMLGLAISGFVVFYCIHKNFAVGFWTLLIGNLAVLGLHLNWVQARKTLEKWYTRRTVRYVHTIGFLCAEAGFFALLWYLFTQFYYKMPILPYEDSVVLSAIWAIVCAFQGILLMSYASKCERLIMISSEPIDEESENDDRREGDE